MSLNKLLSIHDAIYNVIEDTGLDATSNVPKFMRWALDAEKKIGSYYGWKKQFIVLTGDKCRVKLPNNCMRVQRMVFGDYGCDCDTLFNNASNWTVNMNSGSFANTGMAAFSLQVDLDPSGENFSLYDNKYEVQNNCMVFSHSVDGKKVTIQFLGYELDCDGFLMVSENHILPITAYIKRNIAENSRFTPIKMEMGDIKRLENDWIELRNQARGEDAELQPHDQKVIAAMLHDPWSGWGQQIYSDNFYSPYLNYFNS